MKIRAERKALADTISWIAKAVPKSVNTPALAGVRLRAQGDHLTLSAFDYDVSHEATITVEVADEGECLVSASFLGIIGALSGRDVELCVDGRRMTLAAGRSTYHGQLLSLDDYPTIPETPALVGTMPDAAVLADAVTSCLGPADDAAPNEAVRGLHIQASDGAVDLVGLEPRFMVHRCLEWDGGELDATMPGKAVNAAVSGLAGAVTIGASESAVSFSDAERTVVIRTLSGKYADWTRVPRPESEDRFGIVVERDALAEAVKRAALVTRSLRDEGSVLLVLEPDSIEVTATNDGTGGSEVLDAEGDGSESIPYNPTLLSQALAALPAGPIRLGVGKRSPRSPDMGAFLTIRPADGTNDCEAVLAARRGGEVR